MLCGLFTACEKPVYDEKESGKNNSESTQEKLVTITFNSFSVNQSNFDDDTDTGNSRATTSIKDICGRISIALFNSEGTEKVKAANQAKSDNEFGKISISVPKGTYTVVAIAHNGDGNATITSPSEISFKDNKVTDTFYYYGQMDINDNADVAIDMKRAVAMFRLVVKDNTPKAITAMKFYYTGGSSTFDATTGYGCKNSRQTEMRTVESGAYSGESSYDIYTFPHQEEKKLKIDVSALESATATTPTYMRTFTDVSVKRNCITRYSGIFFGEDPATGRGFELTTNDEWGYSDYTY